MGRAHAVKTVATVLTILSVVAGLVILLLDRRKLYPVVYGAMVLFAFAAPALRLKAPTNGGIFIAMPVAAFVAYLLFKLMTRSSLKLKALDFRQGLGMALIVFVLATYIFAVPKGFYL